MAVVPDTFFLKIEPIQSDVPAFFAKASVVSSDGGPPPGIWGPTDPRPTPPIYLPSPPPGIWGPTDPRPSPPIYLPPVETPPTPPEAKLVWIYRPDLSRWIQGYQPADGLLPKAGECQPPAPPGWTFTWVYVPQVGGWMYGYARDDGAAPK